MTAVRSPRSVAALVAVSIVTAATLLTGGTSARADQTVISDDAGSAPHISLFGDSTLTGVRWYGRYGALRQFNYVFSAESCRRTLEQSCIGREGYRASNVIMGMNSLQGQLGRVVVVMSGYNDPVWSFDKAIEGVLAEARRQDVEHVVWLSLRASDDVDYSDPQAWSSLNTFREYNEQLFAAAEASDGFLQVADWATFSLGASSWFEDDGVHLTPRGADAVTSFIAAIVSRVLAGENVSPSAAPWTVLVPGAEGEVVEAVQDALIDAGIDVPGGADGVYGNDTMFAVAAYQREHGGLQVTGAVDMATARSLGVYEDAEAETDAAVATEAEAAATTTVARAPTTTVAAATPTVPARVVDVAVSPTPPADGGGLSRASLLALSAAAALAVAIAGRRRYVVAQRASRGRAIHGRTPVAGLDADRTRPLATGPDVRIYDHELEDANAD